MRFMRLLPNNGAVPANGGVVVVTIQKHESEEWTFYAFGGDTMDGVAKFPFYPAVLQLSTCGTWLRRGKHVLNLETLCMVPEVNLDVEWKVLSRSDAVTVGKVTVETTKDEVSVVHQDHGVVCGVDWIPCVDGQNK